MPPSTQIIHIEPLAPAKPALGAPCNGCGVCCLVEPCPLGIVLSGKRVGACAALQWCATQRKYRCGAVVAPRAVVQAALPVGARWLAPALAWALGRLAKRWIAAGMGCDSTLEPIATPKASTNATVAARMPPR